MLRRTSPSRWLALALLLVCGASHPAAAEEQGVSATLTCRPEAAPGRVLCELGFAAVAGARLTWVDALITRAPSFVRPLRSRVAAERFGGGGELKLSLAFVASGSGTGPVTVLARSVICRGQGDRAVCRPSSREISAEVRVGP